MSKVVLHLRSGQVLNFTCEDFTVTKRSDNTISALSWEGISPAPLYLRLDDISAVIVEEEKDEP